MDYKMAKAAAKWWIEEMKKQCHHSHPQKVINDGSNFVIIDDSFAEELSRFETVLFNEISNCIKKRSYLSLTCCFHPSRDLSNLIQKAKISSDYLPHRATMQICGNSVEVSLNGADLHKLPLSAE